MDCVISYVRKLSDAFFERSTGSRKKVKKEFLEGEFIVFVVDLKIDEDRNVRDSARQPGGRAGFSKARNARIFVFFPH